MKHAFIFALFSMWLLSACNQGSDSTENPSGKIRITYQHQVDGSDLIMDDMIYTNAAGNQFEVNEVMYFISDVTLHRRDGSDILIDEWKDIHYIDLEFPETLTWEVFDDIPIGDYDSISFTFGINEEKNQSFMFTDFPEVNMMWPEHLGGGYHYMMINGHWLSSENLIESFNFHLGIGQLYRGEEENFDSIYAFVHNHFEVSLPNSSFSISKDEVREIDIVMNINSWFEGPSDFDFDFWGGAIMTNQEAMRQGCENGNDAFTIGAIR